MFKGTYFHNIDAKGRMIIPSKFRELLGEGSVMTFGLDGCLFLLPKDVWDEMEEKLMKLPLSDRRSRKLSRLFLSNAQDCEFDRQGRIILTQNLKELAGLSKDVVLIGVGDRIEIWDKERWKSYSSIESDDELAADVEGLGF